MSCNFEYNKISFPEDYKVPMMNHHNAVLIALKDSGIELRTFKEKDFRYRMPVEKRVEADRIIGEIRQTYGNTIKMDKVEERLSNNKLIITDVFTIDVSPLAEKLYHTMRGYERISIEEENNQFNIGGDIMPTQEDRIYKGVDIENLEMANNKAKVMEDRFNNLGISSKIIYDTTMEASGALLGRDTKEYQDLVDQGIIGPGQAAIVVNPNKLYDDTIFHEYGHLLVDILDGTNNTRINKVYESLTNTALFNEVKQTYPELDDEAFRRELVTQALGKKASEIFSTQEEQSTWKKFVLWVKNTFGNIFNTDRETNDELLSLANELLGDRDSFYTGNQSLNTQFKKDQANSKEFKAKKIIQRDLKSLEGIRREIINNTEKQLQKLRKSTNEDVKDYVDALSRIQEDFLNLNDTEDEFVILTYVERISSQIDSITELLVDMGSTTSKQKLDLIGVVNEKIAAFSLITDIKESFDNPSLLSDNEFTNLNTKAALIEIIDDAANKLQNAKGKLNGQALLQVSAFLAPYFNYAYVEAKDRFFREFNVKNVNSPKEYVDSEQYKIDREDYINEQVEADLENIEKSNLALIQNKLRETSTDISFFASRIQDEKDVNNVIIQLVSKIIDDADIQRDTYILDLKLDAGKLFTEWRKTHPGMDPKDMYKGYYEASSDGNLYLITEFSSEFQAAKKKFYKELNNAEEIHGKKSIQYKKASAELKKFTSANIGANGLPIAKWANKDFNKVKDTDMYKWLLKQSYINDQKTNGSGKSNVTVTEEGYTLIKQPNIGKSGLEQLVSGSLLENAWEAIQRIYKIRADETEFGNMPSNADTRRKELYDEIKRRKSKGESLTELADELNMLKVLTNEVGDLKSQVPVFFRGQHNLKDQSYDLMSNLLLDSYMAENYQQKTKFKYAVELTMDLVNSSKVAQTAGLDRKLLVEMFGGDDKLYETIKASAGDQSNSAFMLRSVIENRLYGIKTINSEYAQVASSLMAWTSSAMLGFNFLAASANVIQGKIVNFIESVGGQYMDAKDLAAAEGVFWSDYQGWVDDMGRPIQTSKTNQLMDLLNIQGEFKPFTNKLNEDTRFKTLLKSSTIFSYNQMGEFYIHGTMMYAVLNRIKVKNKEGQFIDRNGKPVTKAKAMNLHQAFEVNKETGKLVLNKFVHSTSFGRQKISLDTAADKGLLEVKNLVNKIANDLHGQYNKEYQSYAQRHVSGKMVFMLRKWMVRGFTRRWRGANKATRDKDLLTADDKFYSEDGQSFNEGYYTSFIRFLSRLTGDIKALGLQGSYTKNKADLTEHEAANIRKTVADLGMMALSILTAMMVYTSLDGLDDDDEEGMLYLAFYSRRLFNEMSFFINPISTFQILRSPAATVSYMEDITKLFAQVIEDSVGIVSGEGLEYYTRGKNKGYPKVWKRFTDLIPVASKLDRNIKESASYQYNLF